MRKGFPESYDRDALAGVPGRGEGGRTRAPRARVLARGLRRARRVQVFGRRRRRHARGTAPARARRTRSTSASTSTPPRPTSSSGSPTGSSSSRSSGHRSTRSSRRCPRPGCVASRTAGVGRRSTAPNLHEFILPTRELADVVIEKGPDHSRDVRIRRPTLRNMSSRGRPRARRPARRGLALDRDAGCGPHAKREWKRHTELPGWTVQDNLVHLSADRVDVHSGGRGATYEAADLART